MVGFEKYVKVRWLSLGESLKRLLDIWQDLLDYMELGIHIATGKEKQKCEKFSKKLKDKGFQTKIIILSSLLTIINRSNKAFQKADLEVHHLKIQTTHCIQAIANILWKEENPCLEIIKELDFNDSKIKQKYFEDSFDSFVSKLQIDLGTLKHFNSNTKKLYFEGNDALHS